MLAARDAVRRARPASVQELAPLLQLSELVLNAAPEAPHVAAADRLRTDAVLVGIARAPEGGDLRVGGGGERLVKGVLLVHAREPGPRARDALDEPARLVAATGERLLLERVELLERVVPHVLGLGDRLLLERVELLERVVPHVLGLGDRLQFLARLLVRLGLAGLARGALIHRVAGNERKPRGADLLGGLLGGAPGEDALLIEALGVLLHLERLLDRIDARARRWHGVPERKFLPLLVRDGLDLLLALSEQHRRLFHAGGAELGRVGVHGAGLQQTARGLLRLGARGALALLGVAEDAAPVRDAVLAPLLPALD